MRAFVAPVLCLWLLFAAPALGSTVESTGGELSFTASTTETNRLMVAESDSDRGKYQISDAGSDMSSSAGCDPANKASFGSVVLCTVDGVAAIRLSLSDADDVATWGFSCTGNCPPKVPGTVPTVPVSVDAGPGDDVIEAPGGPANLIGGTGRDKLTGGPGADVIDARDGEADSVECGAGADNVRSDPQDTVAGDCESVDNGAAAGPVGDLPPGVSINAGARFTNSPAVSVSMRWPRLAASLSIANDGGFFEAQTLPVTPDVPWTLDSSGPERLPKTIYVRFSGGDAGPETYQDDIILDQTAPAIDAASATATPASPARAATSARRLVTVKLRASDRTSGVAALQLGTAKSSKIKPMTFRRTVVLRVGRRTKSVYARVADHAGNIGRWKPIRIRARRR